MSEPITGSFFEHALRLLDLINTCEKSLEQCFDEACGADGRHPRPTLTTSKGQRSLENMVSGYIAKVLSITVPSARDWTLGQKRAMAIWNNRDSLCTHAPEAEISVAPQKATAPKSSEFSITVEDAARAGALTAGAKLIYDALIFGTTIFPVARPAAQGIMMLFGATPTGFEYESPTDRMSREGA